MPYYIALNSVMELLLVPASIFFNWDATPWRRWLTVAAAVVYVAQRVWTYAVYAEMRLKTGTSPLSDEDLAWFRRTLASDYRSFVNVAVFACLAAAAFSRADRREARCESGDAKDRGEWTIVHEPHSVPATA